MYTRTTMLRMVLSICVTLLLYSCNPTIEKQIEKDFTNYYKRVHSEDVYVSDIKMIKVYSVDSVFATIQKLMQCYDTMQLASASTFQEITTKIIDDQELWNPWNQTDCATIYAMTNFMSVHLDNNRLGLKFMMDTLVCSLDSIECDRSLRYTVYRINYSLDKSDAIILHYYALYNESTGDVTFSDTVISLSDVEPLYRIITQKDSRLTLTDENINVVHMIMKNKRVVKTSYAPLELFEEIDRGIRQVKSVLEQGENCIGMVNDKLLMSDRSTQQIEYSPIRAIEQIYDDAMLSKERYIQ